MAFFTVMLPSILQEKKLKLPREFAGQQGGKLTGRAQLSLPNGRVWDVGVVKGSAVGEFWFDDGWSRFVGENSVSEYWFMSFVYAGASSFKVKIFDLTTCEIDYPSGGFDNDGVEEDDSSVQILDSPPNPPTQQTPQFAAFEDSDEDDSVQFLCSSQPLKKKKKNNNNATTSRYLSGSKSSDSDDDQDLGEMLVKELKRREIFFSTMLSHKLHGWPMEIKMAVKEAMAINCGNLPSFLVVMQRHNNKPHRMEHMMNAKSVRLKLSRGGKDSMWDVTMRFMDQGGPLLSGKGFAKFYRDNELKVGDVCLFQMLWKVNVVLQVSICVC
ncbi:unnamed protein product [Linum trigynum]|uniref:TF-B3 domain-containing protein n=1 Tax=Linum trigynum TaxID=586398 RepID=A0AAV2EUE4_9ROSI